MTVPTVTVAADPAPVRVRRAPALEPPFDDETDAAWPVSSGHLPAAGTPTAATPTAATPMAQPGRGPRSQRPVTPRPLRGPAEPVAGPPADKLPGRPPPTPGTIAAQRFVGVCVEILNGHRAVSHLRAVTAPTDLKHVTDQLISRTNRAYLGRPGRTTSAPHRVRLIGMRMCEPRDGVVEAVAVLGYGMQTWAMAVRLERPADVWLCKLVQVV
jgi:hypothetical protein